MSTPSGPSHRNVASIRSPPAPGAPPSPHTPLRAISSTFGSPSALRAEEDCVIIELGARYLRAGFAGDATPKAIIDFGPEEQRRPGDYRRWEVGYDNLWRNRITGKGWGEAHEIWRPDLRGLDLGLVGDRIDRAVREAFTKYMLIDSRPRRMVLAIPSALPLPLLSAILDTMFTSFQSPTISLMSAPVLTTVAAGLRCALVVDIGWAETVVTSVYEYREVESHRSVRAMKLLGEATCLTLGKAVSPRLFEETGEESKEDKDRRDEKISRLVSFEECEEVLTRMVWCKPGKSHQPEDTGLTPVKEEDELGASMRSLHIGQEADVTITIPLRSTNPPKNLRIPFSELAGPCENALFAPDTPEEELDDEELPLHLLVYRSLLHLPVDVRTMCMSRIIFVGGGSHIPGLKRRVLDEVAGLIKQRDWDPVKGKAVEAYRNNSKLRRTRMRQPGPTEVLQDGTSNLPAALQKQEPDPIEGQLKREAKKGLPPIETGYLRAVESLGAWSGASLLSQLKIPAISIVDKDQWLQHGASGASRPSEVTVAAQRQSMGPGAFKSAAGDRSSWTLGLWG